MAITFLIGIYIIAHTVTFTTLVTSRLHNDNVVLFVNHGRSESAKEQLHRKETQQKNSTAI